MSSYGRLRYENYSSEILSIPSFPTLKCMIYLFHCPSWLVTVRRDTAAMATLSLPHSGCLRCFTAVREWSPYEVAQFISSIKLTELSRMFYTGQVDGAALVSMDDEKLRAFGISAVGHRKRILLELERLEKPSGLLSRSSSLSLKRKHSNSSSPQSRSDSFQTSSGTSEESSKTKKTSRNSSRTNIDMKTARWNPLRL